MKIVGLDSLIFAVDNLEDCAQYLIDYGLEPVAQTASGGRFEALDGTAIELVSKAETDLPAAPTEGCMLRKTLMGVADQETLVALTEELSKDREVRQLEDGSIETSDCFGFTLGFQVSVRKTPELVGEIANAPGSPVLRPVNHIGVETGERRIQPRTLSHVVYFVPDTEKAEAFYRDRLGFRTTDRFTGVGPFMQPAGTLDHHTHFFIPAPPFMTGVEHFTFHFAGPNEVIQNGHQFVEKGYQAFWGPGRHVFGSNWFWYFNSPFNCHMEMDADMDLHDTNWDAREAPLGADASQAFLLGYRERWFPGPGAPEKGDYESA